MGRRNTKSGPIAEAGVGSEGYGEWTKINGRVGKIRSRGSETSTGKKKGNETEKVVTLYIEAESLESDANYYNLLRRRAVYGRDTERFVNST